MACINPNDPKFKEILARVGNPLLAEIEFEKYLSDFQQAKLLIVDEIIDKISTDTYTFRFDSENDKLSLVFKANAKPSRAKAEGGAVRQSEKSNKKNKDNYTLSFVETKDWEPVKIQIRFNPQYVESKIPEIQEVKEVAPVEDIEDDLLVDEPIEETPQIKKEVLELFESNPELANAIYEALGFNKEVNSRLTVSQEGSDGFGYVLGLFDSKSERIGKIVYRNKTYLKDKGFPSVNELHLGFEEEYQGKGYFQDALIELLQYDDSPIFISSGRVINDNVFKAVNKLDASKLNVSKIEDGYIITLNAQITQQQKQQAQQLYSQYLDSIFPDSKVKDIVYHGSPSKHDVFKTIDENAREERFKHTGAMFTSDKNYVNAFGENLYSVVLNIKNPVILSDNTGINSTFVATQYYSKWKSESKDGVIGHDALLDLDHISEGNEYVVFKPEQIHILGSKQDIEGFKEFVSSLEVNEPSNFELKAKAKKEIQKIGVNQFLYAGEIYPTKEAAFRALREDNMPSIQEAKIPIDQMDRIIDNLPPFTRDLEDLGFQEEACDL